jgi:hypothetical protein
MTPSQILISIQRDLLLLINPKLSLLFPPETDWEISGNASMPPVTLSFPRSGWNNFVFNSEQKIMTKIVVR